MKKKILLLIAVATLGLTVATKAQVPNYVPTNGLVGYWPFNGNANDESGNGNNGTVNGATLTTDRFGNSNSAYSFDGVNDYIGTSYSGILGNSSRTISAWVKVSMLNGFGSIVNYGSTTSANGGADRFSCQVRNNGIEGVALDIDGSRITYSNSLSNNWHHIVWVFDNSISYSISDVKIYSDGILLSNMSENYVPFPSAGLINTIIDENVKFGSLNNSLNFNGLIDDIGIWNRALSQQEITNMYNGVNYSNTCNSVSGSLVNGLVGYWPFCGNANDQSGNGNNGTVNGATLTTDRFGNSNSAYSFNGTSDFIEVLDNNVLKFETNNKFTLSYWIDATTLSNSQMNVIISKQENAGFNQDGWNSYVETTSNNGFRVQNGNSTNPCATNLLTPIMSINNYYHIVQVYDNGTASIYINGVLGTQQLCSSQIGDNLSDLFIGKPTWTDNTVKGFNGVIDDIGIWNRALNQQEITALYNGNICYQTITVTDTLLINMGITGFNPVTFNNTIKIFPNPTNDHITIDYGNFASLNGYQLKITNSLGQQMFQTAINQQSNYVSLASWGGNGLYFVYIIDPQGNTLDIRKIVLQ